MNIAFVNATRKWGGVKSWTLAFAERLCSFGHDVHIYGRQPAFVEAAVKAVGHGRQVSFGADLNPRAIAFFMSEFRRHATDIVCVNVGKDLATAGIAARIMGIPVIQRIGLPEDIPYRLKTRLLHRLIRPAFLCPCRFIAEGFTRSLPYITPEDVHTVLNGKTATDHTLVAHAPRRLIATQQLNPDKGHDTLLRALARIVTPFECHIVGTGSAETRLKELAASLGIADRVVWHGFRPDVASLLEQSDIFLLASHSEGLPNTLLEGMATGLLPLSRDVGGVGEVIPADLTRWMLPRDADDEAFAARIEEALNLPAPDLLRLRERAREACRQTFDLTTCTRELETWLQHIIDTRHN